MHLEEREREIVHRFLSQNLGTYTTERCFNVEGSDLVFFTMTQRN
jgi:hypothetical protein